MSCVPCIFLRLTRTSYVCYVCAIVLFPGRGVHCLRSCRVSALSMLRKRVLLLSRELSIYTQTWGCRRWDVFSAFPLGTLAPKHACIFISRHKRIYGLRFLIRISTLRYMHNKKRNRSSIIIIYI